MGLMLSTLNQRIEATHQCLAVGELTGAERVDLACALSDLLSQRYQHLLSVPNSSLQT